MFWIKAGILVSGIIYAGILPYTVYKAIKSIGFDPRERTLSHISIQEEYGKKYHRGYTYLLFATAILNSVFFHLLIEIYNLGELDNIISYIDNSSICLIILAFIPFNLVPYKKEYFGYNVQRLLHNLFATLVFVSLAILIIIFNFALYSRQPVLSITGFIILSFTAILLILYISKHSITGFSELIFINGLCIWSIFVTIFTVLR